MNYQKFKEGDEVVSYDKPICGTIVERVRDTDIYRVEIDEDRCIYLNSSEMYLKDMSEESERELEFLKEYARLNPDCDIVYEAYRRGVERGREIIERLSKEGNALRLINAANQFAEFLRDVFEEEGEK